METFSHNIPGIGKGEMRMDVLIITLVFSSVAPLFLWRWHQKALAMLQVPFIMMMWIYLPEVLPLSEPKADATFQWWMLFYLNLSFGYLAFGMGLFRLAHYLWGKENEKEKI
jgi:hypothetical protein